jgi:rhamnulose-1-phosphate aldolase
MLIVHFYALNMISAFPTLFLFPHPTSFGILYPEDEYRLQQDERERTMLAVDQSIVEIGDVGQALHRMGAAEGSSGNISFFLPDDTPGLRGFCLGRFPRAGAYPMPMGANLPAGTLLVTGTGRRLRDVLERPDETLCAIEIETDGTSWLHRSKQYNVEPTSEIDSHVAIHEALLAGVARSHAIVHAQPLNLTYLTHIPEYRDQARFNRQLLRWDPETIVTVPNGFRVLSFETPGMREQSEHARDAMHRHVLAVWSKHGVLARSFGGPMAAVDLIEYAESAATYEVIDIQAGRPANGLSLEELRAICERFNVSSHALEGLPEELLS